MQKHGLGISRRDKKDTRDKPLKLAGVGTLPPEVNLEAGLDVVLDQGATSSCTGHMARQGFFYATKKATGVGIQGSRIFEYYNARDNKAQDTGTTIRSTLRSMEQFGVPDESLWPFSPQTLTTQPSAEAYKAAINSTGLQYRFVDISFRAFQEALAAGFPVLFGIDVYDNFYQPVNGVVGMPAGKLDGGHAITAFGYKQINGQDYLCVRNSWGTSWGDRGNFYLPAAFINDGNLTFDAWVLTEVSQNTKVKDFLNTLLKKINPGVSEDRIFEAAPKLYSLFKDKLATDKPLDTPTRLAILEVLAKAVQ